MKQTDRLHPAIVASATAQTPQGATILKNVSNRQQGGAFEHQESPIGLDFCTFVLADIFVGMCLSVGAEHMLPHLDKTLVRWSSPADFLVLLAATLAVIFLLRRGL